MSNPNYEELDPLFDEIEEASQQNNELLAEIDGICTEIDLALEQVKLKDDILKELDRIDSVLKNINKSEVLKECQKLF